MNLTKISVKRPLTMIMVFCIIIVFGYMGYTKMPVNLMPDIEAPVATVMTTWVGAGPEDIEEKITNVIEDAVSGIGGVETVISMSNEGMSAVMLQFDYGADMTEMMNDIRSKVDSVQRLLPDDAAKPMVLQFDINAGAIGTLVVTSELSGNAVKQYAEDTVKQRLEQITGITSADIRGDVASEIVVKLDPTLLARYGVSQEAISGVLAGANMTFPYGTLTQGEASFTVRSFEQLTSVEDIESLQVVTGTGKSIPLKEVAEVTYGYAQQEAIYRYNGQDSLIIDINKQQSANTVKTMQKVMKVVESINAANSDFKLIVAMDSSEYISQAMNSVWSTLMLSSGIAFVVILAFLKSFRASLIVALAIPLSIIGAIAGLYFSNQTLNIITVGGLVLGVGMVVDTAIVVIENIFKKREQNPDDLEEVTITGTTSVASAVITATLTTVAVFLPMIFTDGMIRMMFGALALSIIYALVFSVIIALTLVPGLFHKFNSGKGKPIQEKPTPILNLLVKGYERCLRYCLKHKILVVLVSITMLGASFAQLGNIGMEIMPMADKGMMTVSIGLPKGLSLEASDYYVSMTEEKLLEVPEVEKMITSLGADAKGVASSASIGITLVPQDERERSTKEIAEEMRQIVAKVPDCTMKVTLDDSIMMGMSGYSLEVSGPDLDVLEAVVKDVEGKLKTVPGFADVTNSLQDTVQEARIIIDKKEAMNWGVNTSSVTSMIRMALEGSTPTTAKIDNYTVDVKLQYKEGLVEGLEDILALKVRSQAGQEVPIGSFASIEMGESAKSLNKTDGRYNVTVSARLEGIDMGKAQILASEALADLVVPRDYTVGAGMEVEMMQESFGSLTLALVMAILLVYMVMVAQFESFKKPFIIMFSVPFAFVGVVLSLILFDTTLSIPAFIGIILLVGIVVNNGIVLIDYIEQLRKEGTRTLVDCIAQGSGTRLRPVLMTTLTTVLAMVPMMIGMGEGSEVMQPMGIVVFGGLTVSTLVTLILVPTIYFIVESRQQRRQQRRQQKREAKKLDKLSNCQEVIE